MLVLTRKENETIRIGDDIEITLIRVKGGNIRIGIDAPKDVKILRGELQACDAESTDADVFAYGGPIAKKQGRKRLPMANAIAPLRGEKVHRQSPLATVSPAVQTISA